MNMRDSTPALAMLRRSLEEAMHPQTVGQILARRGLNAHYQPIVQLRNGAVIGHESLIRGPVDSPPVSYTHLPLGLADGLPGMLLRTAGTAWARRITPSHRLVSMACDKCRHHSAS